MHLQEPVFFIYAICLLNCKNVDEFRQKAYLGKMLQLVFKELGLSSTSEVLYERLLRYGPASARQLAENINIPRPSVYDHLKILQEHDLVTELNEGSKKIFSATDYRNLPRLLEQKIELLESGKSTLLDFLPNIAASTPHAEPKIKFYSGVLGVKKVLNEMLWHNNTDTLTMWPSKEMMELLGPEYLEALNRKRIKRNISVRGIWPKDGGVSLKDYPFMGVGGGFLRELRIAPNHMNWAMSYWLYGDKVAFISSREEVFGFVVHSADFSKLLRVQFELIWPQCKPIQPEPNYTDKFLASLGKAAPDSSI